MSFGFSPGDIGFFIGFGNKVVNALQESKKDYQMAMRQCQGFLAVMDTLKRLDLSRMPANIKQQIHEQSNGLDGFVAEFKQGIHKYEKGLGEYSERGMVANVPRKLQWAFAAADDLDKFRQSMQAQVDMVMLLLQMGFWLLLENVDDLTDIIYRRLLTRPGLPLSEQAKVFTLPDATIDESLVLVPRQPESSHVSALGAASSDDRSDHLVPHQDFTGFAASTEGDRNVSQSVDEYLRALHLPELTGAEAAHMDHHSQSPLLLTNGAMGDPKREASPDQFSSSQHRNGGTREKWRFPSKIQMPPAWTL
ncbi:hypothetical protein LTR86_005601 [Recurvomyces mirabilis]|nr:hypothetical protein LTR86_005601 [Recurvomyces mirabilis]